MQVYADNAATTKPSRTALDAMLPCFEQFYGNPSSLHHVGQAAAEVLLQARQDMADCLGCEAREIYFTSGGSEADNQALRSAAWAGARKGKKHIVSTAFEHHAVLHTLEQLKEEGFTVTLLDVHETGRITPEEVEAAIQPDTCTPTTRSAPLSRSPRSAPSAASTACRSTPMRCRQRDTCRFTCGSRTSTCFLCPATNSTAPVGWVRSTSARAFRCGV